MASLGKVVSTAITGEPAPHVEKIVESLKQVATDTPDVVALQEEVTRLKALVEKGNTPTKAKAPTKTATKTTTKTTTK